MYGVGAGGLERAGGGRRGEVKGARWLHLSGRAGLLDGSRRS